MDQVEEIKSKSDIVAIIGRRVDLKKAGRNFRGKCPFHNEKTPSFNVSPELQIYKCFGCGASGDVYSFLQEYEGMTFFEALKSLAEETGIILKSTKRESGEREKLLEINDTVAKFYHYVLINHSEGVKALDYLTDSRGLTPETIREFRIGFSPNDSRVYNKFIIQKKGFDPKDLEKLGLAYPRGRNVIDRFGGRVMFPLTNTFGSVLGFSGRILPGVDKLAKYINSPETVLYHKSSLLFGLSNAKDEIRKIGSSLVVEGELDMISMFQNGFKNTVAIKGSAFTEEQTTLISRFARKIVLALDSDFAGNEAAMKGIKIAQEAGLSVKVARFDGKDPDEAVRKDKDVFKKSIDNAIGVWDFIIDVVFEKYDAETGEGKSKISRELTPVLASISDNIVQAHYIDVVAEKLGVDREAVMKEVEKKDTPAKIEVAMSKESNPHSQSEMMENQIVMIGLLIDQNVFYDQEIYDMLLTNNASRVFSVFQSTYPQEDIASFDIKKLREKLPEDLVEYFDSIVMVDVDFKERDVENALHDLKKHYYKEEMNKMVVDLRKYEERGDDENIQKIQESFEILRKKLSRLEGFEK